MICLSLSSRARLSLSLSKLAEVERGNDLLLLPSSLNAKAPKDMSFRARRPREATLFFPSGKTIEEEARRQDNSYTHMELEVVLSTRK